MTPLSWQVIYLNEWYEQVLFDVALQTSFTLTPEGVMSTSGGPCAMCFFRSRVRGVDAASERTSTEQRA